MSGTLQTVYGTIAAVSADNPASNALGGFKEGFTAFRHCRQCMGTSAECKHEVSTSRMSFAHTKLRSQKIVSNLLGFLKNFLLSLGMKNFFPVACKIIGSNVQKLKVMKVVIISQSFTELIDDRF